MLLSNSFAFGEVEFRKQSQAKKVSENQKEKKQKKEVNSVNANQKNK